MTWSKERLPSRYTTEGVANSFHRVFYYAMGLSTEEIHQPHVGVVTAWDDTTPMHDAVRAVAERVKEQLWAYELTPREFTTIPGFDREGVVGAPPRDRELIADSIELTVRGHCSTRSSVSPLRRLRSRDSAMAACRLDVPSVIVPVMPADDALDGDGPATVATLAALGLTAAGPATGDGASIRSIGDRVANVLAERLREGVRPRSGVSVASLARAAEGRGHRGRFARPLVAPGGDRQRVRCRRRRRHPRRSST